MFSFTAHLAASGVEALDSSASCFRAQVICHSRTALVIAPSPLGTSANFRFEDGAK